MDGNTWYINLDCKYFDTQEFLSFMKTTECRMLLFLTSKIVRKMPKVRNYYINKIFNKYYENGMLCARYDQNTLARIFKWGGYRKPNRKYVSKITRNLENMRLLKRHKDFNNDGNYSYVYQLGYIDPETKEEVLFYDLYFSLAVEKEKKFREKVDEVDRIKKQIELDDIIEEYNKTISDHFKQELEKLYESYESMEQKEKSREETFCVHSGNFLCP